MTDFYQLPLADLESRYESLVRDALPLWDIDRDSPLALLKLRENAVFSVLDRAQWGENMLSVSTAPVTTPMTSFGQSGQWMNSLREYGVSTPVLRYSGNNRMFEIVAAAEVPEARQVDIVRWIEGEQLGSVEEGLEGTADEIRERFETLGSIMANMHNHAEQWREPDGFTRHAWDVDGLTGAEPFWGRFWELPGTQRPAAGNVDKSER